jgi:DNA-binding transcriptional LysR family regulator
MPETLPTIEQAKALVAVVRQGSYTEAAKDLDLERTAVIRRIERLTTLIGRGALLRRGGRGTTQLGDVVLQQAERVLAAANGMLRPQQAIRLSTYPTIAAHVVTSCPGLFDTETAALTLYEIDEASRRDGGARLIRRLVDGDVDIVIAPERHKHKGLDDAPLYEWTLQAVIADNHPLRAAARGRPGLSVEDIASFRIVAAPVMHTSRQALDELFADAGRTLTPAFESPNQRLLEQLARNSSRHVAAIPSDSFWPADEASPGIDLVDAQDTPRGGRYCVFTRKILRSQQGAREQEIKDVVKAIVNNLGHRVTAASRPLPEVAYLDEFSCSCGHLRARERPMASRLTS